MENTSNLKSGTCPKCGTNEIYTTRGGIHRGERMKLVLSFSKTVFLDTYLCLNCGHFEEYINDSDLKDQGFIEEIRKNCVKV